MGLPFLMSRSKSVAFQFILDKVVGKINGYRAKILSQAGRSVLIKSVASTIPSMGTFLLPDSICHKLDKIFKYFWWGFPKGKSRNLSLKSWRSMCTPRQVGRMGFRLMKDVNLALIAKLGWKLLTKFDYVWVSPLIAKYIKYENFFTHLQLLQRLYGYGKEFRRVNLSLFLLTGCEVLQSSNMDISMDSHNAKFQACSKIPSQ